jgi:hypothetical protein
MVVLGCARMPFLSFVFCLLCLCFLVSVLLCAQNGGECVCVYVFFKMQT